MARYGLLGFCGLEFADDCLELLQQLCPIRLPGAVLDLDVESTASPWRKPKGFWGATQLFVGFWILTACHHCVCRIGNSFLAAAVIRDLRNFCCMRKHARVCLQEELNVFRPGGDL